MTDDDDDNDDDDDDNDFVIACRKSGKIEHIDASASNIVLV